MKCRPRCYFAAVGPFPRLCLDVSRRVRRRDGFGVLAPDVSQIEFIYRDQPLGETDEERGQLIEYLNLACEVLTQHDNAQKQQQQQNQAAIAKAVRGVRSGR